MSDYINGQLEKILDLAPTEDIEDQLARREEDIKNGSVPQNQLATIPNAEIGEPEKFGLATYEAKPLVQAELTDETDKSDKELARAAIRNVINVSSDSLAGLLAMAKYQEHPRGFEVAATFAKTIIDAATKLDDMIENKAKKGTPSKDVPSTQYNQQNNIVMSTEDAMKMIREGMLSQGKSENQSQP